MIGVEEADDGVDGVDDSGGKNMSCKAFDAGRAICVESTGDGGGDCLIGVEDADDGVENIDDGGGKGATPPVSFESVDMMEELLIVRRSVRAYASTGLQSFVSRSIEARVTAHPIQRASLVWPLPIFRADR